MRARDLEALGFPKVLESLATLAVSPVGREVVRGLRPLPARADAERALDRQWSFARLADTVGPVPLVPFPDVRESLALAGHENAVLPGERLIEVRSVLQVTASLRRFLQARTSAFPVLEDLPRALHPLPELEAALTRMLDENGILRDDASPHLAGLRAALRELRHEIEERLDRLVLSSGAADAIADRYVTVRNNRFVVPVKAGASGRLGGVVQDRSASGETFFIEPLFAIELNNRLLLLRKEEEIEELRLLGLLTAQVGAARHELARSLVALADIDRLAAGAAFARRFRCTRPRLEEAVVDLRGARNPELLLSGRAVTAVDVRLQEGRTALVLSGPNTGGKTVALKTLGLLTALAHSGVLVPAEEGSTIPFVTGLFTDLSDEQSIERDLSTFSSHVANLVEIFRALEPPALVLLDEPGGGTDPEEGAALAVGLIDRLVAAGVLVAAATHAAPVKLYALTAPAVEVAAVEVDPRSFAPRFRLLYGSVGQSLGLAMARRLGLPAAVLEAAEAHRADSDRTLADAIARLEESRRRFEDERRALVEERRAVADLEREQAPLVAELHERRRARWSADLAEARDFLRTLKAEGRALLEALRRRPAEAAADLDTFVQTRESQVAERASEFLEHHDPGRAPVIGDQVEVRGTAIRGELVEVAGESARVRRGALTFRVSVAQLAVARGPAPAEAPVAQPSGVLADAPTELRLVGLRAREALERLERFLDLAQRAGLPSVRIVHGLGTGALKRAVADYLAGSPYCTRFHEAEAQAGGAGVTVAELG